MATEADAPEREDELETVLDPQPGDEGHEDGEVHSPEDEGDDADDFEISFDGEAAPASSEKPDLVKHLRAEIRKRDEDLAALRSGKVQPQVEQIVVGDKPTLESCDYDEERFESELFAHKERERKAAEANAQVSERQQAETARYEDKVRAYAASKTALKAKDFDVAEGVVLTTLSPVQQAIVIKAADDSAKVIYALGRHPDKAKQLAAIADPIEFTKALVKLEGQLKVTARARTPIDPDVPARGSGRIAQGSDKTLEKLEATAARTGNRTEVIRYKLEQKAKASGKS